VEQLRWLDDCNIDISKAIKIIFSLVIGKSGEDEWLHSNFRPVHSHLVQYRRQQSKNEEASDYNLLKAVLRFCPILICPFSFVHSVFTSYSYFPFAF